MATPVTGHGGYLIRSAVSGGSDPFDANKRFDIGAWEYQVEAVIDNATESNASGWERGLTGLYRVASLKVDVIQKTASADIFELSCATLGSTFTLALKKGAATKGDLFTDTMLQSVGKVCRSDDGTALRCTFMFVKGVVSFDQTMPSLP